MYTVAGVVVLAVLVWAVVQGKITLPTLSSLTSKPTYKSATPTPAPGGSPLPQSYNQALITYASRRMQFDAYCQATPNRISISKGQSVMLDNRSGDSRTFAVGGVYFTLSGYGWRIFTPTAAKYPATLYVDCGSARNVGTIIVQ